MKSFVSAVLLITLTSTSVPLIPTRAEAQNFDRGFADLVKKTGNGVVNISTYTKQRIQMNPAFPGNRMGPGGPGGPNDDLFRRFFEEFFGGRLEEGPMPGQPQQPRGPRGRMPRNSEKSVPLALGTGFVIDSSEGLILTNNHVIQNADEVKIQLVEDDLDLIPAEIIGRDPELDVALLKVKTKVKLTQIALGNSDAIDVGEYVLAIGNPLGYGHTVSHGILSAKGRRNPEFRLGKYLQTDASINPGNSGGPLLNMKGEVIGINNAIDARAQGIGFAIPINMVKNILPQLKSKGAVSRGYLGVSAGDLNPEAIEQLKLPANTRGVLVADVAQNQPADKAGLKPFDVITEVNGTKVATAQDLTFLVTAIPVGEKAKITYVRQGKEKVVEVKVGERPYEGMAEAPKRKKMPAPSAEREAAFETYGFSAENIMDKNDPRVAVTELDYGKPAVESGLNRGDIILNIVKDGNNYAVKNVDDLAKYLGEAKGKPVMLRIKRPGPNGDAQVTVLTLK